MSIFTDIWNSTQESGAVGLSPDAPSGYPLGSHYQVVLVKDLNGVPAGTVFGEYCSYYSANLAASDSEFADYLAIHDLRQGKI